MCLQCNKKTLILYEGRYGHSKRTAEILEEMIPDSKCTAAGAAPEELEEFENLILVFGFLAYDTAKVLKPYLEKHREPLQEMKVGIVGVGLAKQALPAFGRIIEEPMGREADRSWFVMGGYRVADLIPEDRKLLESFWSKKEAPLTDKEFFKEEEVRSVGKEVEAHLRK